MYKEGKKRGRFPADFRPCRGVLRRRKEKRKEWKSVGNCDKLEEETSRIFCGGGEELLDGTLRGRAGAWALALTLLLGGCGAAAPADPGGAEAVREAAEPEERPISEEEILNAYDRAVTAWEWFDLRPLSCGEDGRMVDGRVYYPVEDVRFGDLDDLRAYLRSLFSEGVTERLLAAQEGEITYRDLDGSLYAAGTSRSRDPRKSNIQTAVVQETDTVYQIEVTLDLLGEDFSTVTGLECWAFPYERQGDGRWVFTDFCLVY